MRIFITLCIIISVLCSLQAQVLTGQKYKSVLESSINILDNNLQILRAHALEKEGFKYWHICLKRAPVQILTSDGVLHKGTVERQQMPFGFIGGDETGGFFAGFNADAAVFQMDDILGYEDKPKRFSTGQIMYHAGLELVGFQLQVGSFLNFGGGNLFDGNGDFPAQGVKPLEDGKSTLRDSKKRVFTGYHESGIFFSAIYENLGYYDYDNIKDEKKYTFTEFKLNLQPRKKVLPKAMGKPYLDILKMSSKKSYYNESLEKSTNKNPYQISFGINRFLLKGLSFEVSSQIRTEMTFRKSEVSYTFGFGNFVAAGARSVVYMNNDKPQFSFDALLMVYYLKKFNFTVSYSYNGYDLTSFLPIPYTHAIGIHVLLGNPKTFRFPIPDIERYIKGEDEDEDDEG